MKRLFTFLLEGYWNKHEHNWESIKELSVWDKSRGMGMPSGFIYVLRCTHCGDIKAVTVRGC